MQEKLLFLTFAIHNKNGIRIFKIFTYMNLLIQRTDGENVHMINRVIKKHKLN